MQVPRADYAARSDPGIRSGECGMLPLQVLQQAVEAAVHVHEQRRRRIRSLREDIRGRRVRFRSDGQARRPLRHIGCIADMYRRCEDRNQDRQAPHGGGRPVVHVHVRRVRPHRCGHTVGDGYRGGMHRCPVCEPSRIRHTGSRMGAGVGGPPPPPFGNGGGNDLRPRLSA